jgi:hypothetical protein
MNPLPEHRLNDVAEICRRHGVERLEVRDQAKRGPPDLPHPLQVKAWRDMGAAARSQMGIDLRRTVRGWKRAALHAQHPDWPEERLGQELARLYLRGNT